jgi:glycine/D-amino acid oxidase-like deaminating enzyme
MTPTYDMIVIGGGIVGTACAAEAARAGLQVALVEKDAIGSGATAAGMGHVLLMDDNDALLDLTRLSLDLWSRLSPHLPESAQYVRSGTIWVAADDEEMAEVKRKAVLYASLGIANKVLNPARLAELEPNLRDGLAGGLLVSGDGIVYSPSAAMYLWEQAVDCGAVGFIGVAVTAIEESAVHLSDGRTLSAKLIVNATGHLAGDLLDGLHVIGRKGHLVITDRYPGLVHHPLVELGYIKKAHSGAGDSVAFVVQPRPTGQVLIGSSRQFDAPEKTIDQVILNQMLARVFEYMPVLGNLSTVRIWTGMRAATPDKLPLIGRHPAYETVYLATGHEGLGITTSLATAQLLLDQILDRTPAIPTTPYLPNRAAQWVA